MKIWNEIGDERGVSDILGQLGTIHYLRHEKEQAEIIRFWETEYRRLQSELKGISPNKTVKVAKRLKRYNLISLHVGDFMGDVSGLLYRSYSELKKNGFKELMDEVHSLAEPLGTKTGDAAETVDPKFPKTAGRLPSIKFQTNIGTNNGKVVNLDRFEGTLNIS